MIVLSVHNSDSLLKIAVPVKHHSMFPIYGCGHVDLLLSYVPPESDRLHYTSLLWTRLKRIEIHIQTGNEASKVTDLILKSLCDRCVSVTLDWLPHNFAGFSMKCGTRKQPPLRSRSEPNVVKGSCLWCEGDDDSRFMR